MKHVKTGEIIIPKILSSDKWTYLGEKIFIGNIWIKLNYFDISLILDNFGAITLSDHIETKVSFNYNLIG